MAKTRSCDWILTTNDGTTVVAVHRPTGETFTGTLDNFRRLLNNEPLTTGMITSGGSGEVCTTAYVGRHTKHRVFNGHATQAITVDGCLEYGNVNAWAVGISFQKSDGTYATSLTSKMVGFINAQYDAIRLTAVAASTGIITSYKADQL